MHSQNVPAIKDVGGSKWSVEVGVVLAERLRARRGEIEEAIIARVQSGQFEGTGREDREYVAGLRAASVAALEYVLGGIECGGRSLAVVPGEVIAQARRAARVGVGSETVLRRYVAGYAVLEDFLVQETERDRSLGRDGLRGVLRVTAVLVDRLIAAVSRAYGKELERVVSPPESAVAAGSSDGAGGVVQPGRGMVLSRMGTVSEQRVRILRAMVQVAAERGYGGTTVKEVSARAGVSTRTFYERFDGLESCFVAVLDLGVQRTIELIGAAFARQGGWQDGVRCVLGWQLAFLDSEPALAWCWMVESLGAGSWAHEHRERNIVLLRERVLAGWPESKSWGSPPLIAEGVMSSVMGVVHAHLVTGKPEPLIELLGPLMGLIVAPYLGPGAAEAEVGRARELARAIAAGDPEWAPPAWTTAWSGASDEPPASPRGEDRPTRALECLLFLDEQCARGGRPSNREIAAGIGIAHESQIARLLARLHGEGLVSKHAPGGGRPNAWELTARAEELVQGWRGAAPGR